MSWMMTAKVSQGALTLSEAIPLPDETEVLVRVDLVPQPIESSA